MVKTKTAVGILGLSGFGLAQNRGARPDYPQDDLPQSCCPESCSSCDSNHIDCSNAGLTSINIEEFSCLEAESINLSSNAFKTFPKELSKFSNLKTIDLSNNPIKSLGEFALNGAEDAYRYLEEVKFENCGEFDYVGDAAFSFLKSLESVSFSGSELFYLSGQAFYDCQKLKNLDLSNTNVKYIDSCLPIYLESLENINVDGSKMECDCVNAWLQGAEFNNGYNCDDANEVAECAPKVAKDGYNFEFQEDTSQSAICFIVGAKLLETKNLNTGRQNRGRHSIQFLSVDSRDQGEYECLGTTEDDLEAISHFTIDTIAPEEPTDQTGTLDDINDEDNEADATEEDTDNEDGEGDDGDGDDGEETEENTEQEAEDEENTEDGEVLEDNEDSTDDDNSSDYQQEVSDSEWDQTDSLEGQVFDNPEFLPTQDENTDDAESGDGSGSGDSEPEDDEFGEANVLGGTSRIILSVAIALSALLL